MDAWFAAFLQSPDRARAVALAIENTDPRGRKAPWAVEGMTSDPKRCEALANKLAKRAPLQSWAWRMLALRASDESALAGCVLNDVRLLVEGAAYSPERTLALSVMGTWLSIADGSVPSYGTDLFAAVHRVRSRKSLPAPAKPDIAVDLLKFGRWDYAALMLHRRTLATDGLSSVSEMVPEKLLLSNDRVAVRAAIEGFVDFLFRFGDAEKGKLAIAWMMLAADAKRPTQFAYFMPQLQRMLDGAPIEDLRQRELQQKRMETWWDAADGEWDNSDLSVFALASFESSDAQMAFLEPETEQKASGFERVRRTATAIPSGPSLIVMPTAKGSKLNNYHGAFKEIVDAALPLVVVRDLAGIRRTLQAEYPHATTQVDMLLRDLREDKPFKLKPVVLLGNPGSGKSRLLRRLCELTEVFCYRFDCTSSHDNMFGGVSKSWGNTEASVPARAVAQSKSASPLVMLDELEKAGVHWQAGGLHSALLPFLDGETAKRFRDPSLDWELDLSGVSFVATANDVTKLPAPLRDRFRVIRVPDPSIEHLPSLAAGVMAEMAKEDELRAFDAPLAVDELDVVGRAWRGAGFSMRSLQKIVAATLDARDNHAMRH